MKKYLLNYAAFVAVVALMLTICAPPVLALDSNPGAVETVVIAVPNSATPGTWLSVTNENTSMYAVWTARAISTQLVTANTSNALVVAYLPKGSVTATRVATYGYQVVNLETPIDVSLLPPLKYGDAYIYTGSTSNLTLTVTRDRTPQSDR